MSNEQIVYAVTATMCIAMAGFLIKIGVDKSRDSPGYAALIVLSGWPLCALGFWLLIECLGPHRRAVETPNNEGIVTVDQVGDNEIR